MSYKSLMRRSTRRQHVDFLSDSDSETEDKVPAKSTPLSAPPLQTELALSSGGLVPRQAPLSNPQVQAAAAASSVLAPKQGKAGNHAPQDLMFQGFDSPQQPQLSAPKSPQWIKPDNRLSPPKSPQYANPDNKENALPEPSSITRKSPGSHMPVDARTLQRVETLEQSFLQHQQQVQTQLESMQEQLTALSQKQLDIASFPEQVVHHIEQDLAEVISRLDRQVDSLTGRVDKLPNPEDWTIMEEALAAILDEAAARAEQEERLAAQEHSGASEAADEAGQASYGESRVKEEAGQDLDESFSAAAPSEQQDAACNTMAIVIKEESEDLLSGAGPLVDQAQLEEVVQQQQAETQSRLDTMNEKIENWVCQCFSDLRNRIIELEAASLIAKAEVLQASIGVSCSEEDIQTTTQDHIVHASVFQRSPESSKAIQSINGAVDGMQSSGAAAVDKQVEMRQDGVQGLSCVANAATDKQLSTHRFSQPPLTRIQFGGVALALLAALFWYGAIELWRRNSEVLHLAH